MGPCRLHHAEQGRPEPAQGGTAISPLHALARSRQQSLPASLNRGRFAEPVLHVAPGPFPLPLHQKLGAPPARHLQPAPILQEGRKEGIISHAAVGQRTQLAPCPWRESPAPRGDHASLPGIASRSPGRLCLASRCRIPAVPLQQDPFLQHISSAGDLRHLLP